MSYLDAPRLHFFGKFSALPSTVNNNPHHYNNSAIIDPNPRSNWNPNGNHSWTFEDCIVRTAIAQEGEAPNDPAVGARLESVSQPPAKIVDLDPYKQNSSEIWGLELKLALPNSGDGFTGSFEVVGFNDIWIPPGDHEKDRRRACYQSVIRDLTWTDSISSPILQALRDTNPEAVSIKFNVDHYNHIRESGGPGTSDGRIAGTIGPAIPDEPSHFIDGRFLRPERLELFPLEKDSNFGTCQVKGSSVVFDLGNGLAFNDKGGLRAAILDKDDSVLSVLGAVDNSLKTYRDRAGIQVFDLSDEQRDLATESPIAILAADDRKLLWENPSGIHVNSRLRICRMNPRDRTQVELIATRFGQRYEDLEICLHYRDDIVFGTGAVTMGRPESALPLPRDFAKTDSKGRVEFTLIAGDPGNPRVFIDGQFYGVGWKHWEEGEGDGHWVESKYYLSILIHDSLNELPLDPTWDDVKDVLTQYARLYPYMTEHIVDLGSHEAIINFGPKNIARVMRLPKSHPGFMPVTRDLSRDKTELILRWLDAGAP